MSILIDKDTSMLIIGITGKQGRIHCKHILDTGSKLLAGVAPGRGGQEVEGVPVFETVCKRCCIAGVARRYQITGYHHRVRSGYGRTSDCT